MTEEDVFLDALRAAPEDETTRPVYADWLEERGDPRSEYVRLLSALDMAGDGPCAADLLARLHRVQLEQRLSRRWVTLLCRGRLARLLRGLQSDAPRQGWAGHPVNRELARRWHALPVYADMGGIILMRPDGELLTAGDDDEASPLTDRRWRLIGENYWRKD
jgi:uncharacterized protein (TIGR02996 family)